MHRMRLFPIALLIGVSIASAQGLPSGRLVKDPARLAPAVKAEVRRSGDGQLNIDMNSDFDQSFGLSSFKFFFNNGDHRIKSIGLLPKDNHKVVATFIDKDGHDPYSVRATYWKLDGVRGDEVFFDANSKESRIIPQPEGAGEFAISGFHVGLEGYADCNITDVHVGIRKYPDGSKMVVDLGQECSNVRHMKGSVVWVPSAVVTNKRHVNGNGRRKQDANGGLPVDDRFLLQDFKIRFTNGGHFLRGFGVELFPPANSNEVISWQDNDKDDPVEWSATVLLIDRRMFAVQ